MTFRPRSQFFGPDYHAYDITEFVIPCRSSDQKLRGTKGTGWHIPADAETQGISVSGWPL